MRTYSKYTIYAGITILGFLIFRIFYIATTHYDLIADEAYFWDWSRHPALSYYDMGPMVAWIIRFFTSIFSLSEFSVHLGAPVFSAMTSIVVYILAMEVLKSTRLAFILILLFNITPISAVGGVIMTYYSPQVFFMSLTAFFLWRLIKEEKGWWWYLIGMSLGLGLLSHHMFFFFSAEVGLFILLSKNNRRWLKQKEPYIALVIELIVASPIFIWNLMHNSVMFRHATGLMSISPKALITFIDFVGGQAGVQTPFFFLAVTYGLCICAYRGIVRQDDKHLMLLCLSGPVIIFIAFLSFGGRTEANWPISGYITGGIAGVAVFSEIYNKGAKAAKYVIRAAFVFTLALGGFALIVVSYPTFLNTAFGISLPPRLDPANRLYGWKQLGVEVSKVLKTMPEGSFVSSRDYGLNALLAFYVDGNPQVYEIPGGRRMSQYGFWNNTIPVLGKDSVFVDKRPIKNRIEDLFGRVELAKHLIIYQDYTGKIRKQLYIYKCFNFKGSDKNINSF